MYVVSEQTKKRMSQAKKGRKYTAEHKLNMKVSHILKYSIEKDYCPVLRVLGHTHLPPIDVKTQPYILREIKRRSPSNISEEGQKILDKLSFLDK